MTRPLLTVIAALAFISTAKAEIIESVVTLQAKLNYQKPNVNVKEGLYAYNYAARSYKTSDLIQRIAAEQELTDISTKAQLIFHINGAVHKYIIRDKGTDHEVKAPYLFFYQNDYYMRRGKDSSKGGTIKNLGAGECRISPDEGLEIMRFTGTVNGTRKVVLSKQSPGDFVEYAYLTMTGIGYYDLSPNENTATDDYGIVQVTFKLSPPKILPSPPANPPG